MIASNLHCWLLGQMRWKSYPLTRFIYVKLLCHNFLKACNKIEYLKKLFISLIQFQFLSGFMFFSVDRCHCRKVWITFDICEIGIGFLW